MELPAQTGSPCSLVPGYTFLLFFFFLSHMKYSLQLIVKIGGRLPCVHVTEIYVLEKSDIPVVYRKLTVWISQVVLAQYTRGSFSLLTQLKCLSVANWVYIWLYVGITSVMKFIPTRYQRPTKETWYIITISNHYPHHPIYKTYYIPALLVIRIHSFRMPYNFRTVEMIYNLL